MKSQFEQFYANKVAEQINKGVAVESVTIDLRLSVVKPLHAKWITKAADEIAKNGDLVKKAWTMASIC